MLIDGNFDPQHNYSQNFLAGTFLTGIHRLAGVTKNTLYIIIDKPMPTGGGYIEEEPEPHPFRLIETKAIVVPIRKPNIIVKVNIEELYVEANHIFTKYNEIRIMFRGIE